MFDEISSILEQLAARHHTSPEEVRREIALALRQSGTGEQSPEDIIAVAALETLLRLQEPARS